MKRLGKTFGPGEIALRAILAALPDGTIEEWRSRWCAERGTTITLTAFRRALRRVGAPRHERRGRHANGQPSVTHGEGRAALLAALRERPGASCREIADAVAERVGHRFSAQTIGDARRREVPDHRRVYPHVVDEGVLRDVDAQLPDETEASIADEYRYRTGTDVSDTAIYFALRRHGLRVAAPATRRRLAGKGAA